MELGYTKNLTKHYNNYADLPGFVLLESSDKRGGRYDILSAYPYDYLKVDHKTAAPGKIFNILNELIPKTTSSLDLPFQGGAIGYFSYDFAARLAGIDSPGQPGLRDLPLVELGLYDWAIIADHHLKRVSLFIANTQSETANLVAEICLRWQQGEQENNSFILKQLFSPLISKDEYQRAFHEIYQELQRGRSYQVNYTQPFKARYEGDSWGMYKQVRATNPVPYSAFLRSANMDVLSFSPERFLMMEKGVLLTSPIKGTEKRSTNRQHDKTLRNNLLESSKNRAENIMIVDLLRNDLGKISKAGTVRVRDLCAVESYQAVHHLVSHIEGQSLEHLSALDAFSSCFPGGSITGAPKLEAMRIIAEQEAYARGVYCGSIGYFSCHGRFDTNIAIRTVLA
ncbi:MAG: anthranilate synthase component I family protein, partial [Tatlockia sp.]|nr:anthranilate synthase component I family protein [Tatlockia sp.]